MKRALKPVPRFPSGNVLSRLKVRPNEEGTETITCDLVPPNVAMVSKSGPMKRALKLASGRIELPAGDVSKSGPMKRALKQSLQTTLT